MAAKLIYHNQALQIKAGRCMEKTTDAVHAFGTPTICQLMHGGRVSDSLFVRE